MDAVADLAYMAGIIDGEGSITIARLGRAHSLRVSVKMTDTEAIELIRQEYGGSAHVRLPTGLGRRIQCDLVLCAEVAERFLRAVLPYLRIKKAQAEAGLAFQAEKNARKAAFKTSRLTEDELAWRDNYRLYIVLLNGHGAER